MENVEVLISIVITLWSEYANADSTIDELKDRQCLSRSSFFMLSMISSRCI